MDSVFRGCAEAGRPRALELLERLARRRSPRPRPSRRPTSTGSRSSRFCEDFFLAACWAAPASRYSWTGYSQDSKNLKSLPDYLATYYPYPSIRQHLRINMNSPTCSSKVSKISVKFRHFSKFRSARIKKKLPKIVEFNARSF